MPDAGQAPREPAHEVDRLDRRGDVGDRVRGAHLLVVCADLERLHHLAGELLAAGLTLPPGRLRAVEEAVALAEQPDRAVGFALLIGAAGAVREDEVRGPAALLARRDPATVGAPFGRAVLGRERDATAVDVHRPGAMRRERLVEAAPDRLAGGGGS